MAGKQDKLTVKEAAEMIGVKVQTVYNWKCDKRYGDYLTFHRRALNGRLFLLRGEVEKFIDEYENAFD